MVPPQTTDALLQYLENAFHRFCGVIKILELDNLKAGVPKADLYDPVTHGGSIREMRVFMPCSIQYYY